MTRVFFNDTATTEIYTLSLHDALPISRAARWTPRTSSSPPSRAARSAASARPPTRSRSEEHTSELQSRQYLVCRLLLVKKKDQFLSYTLLIDPKSTCLNSSFANISYAV